MLEELILYNAHSMMYALCTAYVKMIGKNTIKIKKKKNSVTAYSYRPMTWLLQKLLGLSLGVRGVVKKTRHLYMVGQTRVHIDQVNNLGDFMELEVQCY